LPLLIACDWKFTTQLSNEAQHPGRKVCTRATVWPQKFWITIEIERFDQGRPPEEDTLAIGTKASLKPEGVLKAEITAEIQPRGHRGREDDLT
jgi:hypothetical protein